MGDWDVVGQSAAPANDPWAVKAQQPKQPAQAPVPQPQQPPSPQAAAAFQRFGVSPNEYDFDPQTNTIKRKPGPMFTLGGLAANAVKPITSYPETYSQMNRESREQMSRGYEQFKTAGERVKGVANMGLGALGYTFSPINAALRTVVGAPVEENTGIPKEYTEFATGLAMPGLGFGRAPKTLEKILSPETVSQEALDAAALIRQETGRAARSTEQTATSLEEYWKPVSQLSTSEQLGIMHFIEGTGGGPLTPKMQQLATTLKDALEARKAALQAMPEYAHRQFLDEYFPHFWKDPNRARNAFSGSGGGIKQGSGASLRERTIPTIADGMRMGLEPLTTNPIEATLRYVTSMDKFIASQNMLRAGKDSGTIIYRRPSAMGASGHPDSIQGIPPGYTALKGRGSENAAGEKAFAPDGWARVYNNYISRGVGEFGEEFQNAYDTMRRAANATTQSLLGFSGYHFFTMAEATMSDQMQRIATNLRKGQVGEAVKQTIKFPTSAVRYAWKGRKFRDMYLDRVPMSPEQKQIIDLLTDAGARMHGTKHALDYESSALGSYYQAFKRGRLQGEMMAGLQDIKNNPGMGTLRQIFQNVGRTMDTFNQPLFQHYIPAIKNTAAYEGMADFLKQHPNATLAEQQAAARKIVDSVDNRFGEMIQDNIFWNKAMKQAAMLTMLSYSWNMGAIREIGGGVRDVARVGVGRGEWTTKADYVVGMTLNWAIMSAIYQKLKTGQGPETVKDLVAPRTGGVDARTGEDERIIPPGIMKDVFGYTDDFPFGIVREMGNKLNPAIKMALQTASIFSGMGGKDWRDDPIISPRAEGQGTYDKTADWLAEYFNYILRNASPIQMQNLFKGPEEGSALNSVELALGIRKAPRRFVDPEHEKMLRSIWQRKWQQKLRHDKAEEQRYGGTD